MLGNIKGHDIGKVNAKKIKDEKFRARFTDAEAVENAVIRTLKSKGAAYCLTDKEKACVSVYCFEKVLDEDGKHFKLVMNNHWCADGLEAEDAEFRKALHEEIKEVLLFTGVDKAEWDGEVLTCKSEGNSTYITFFFTYLTLAIVFYNVIEIHAISYGFFAASICYLIAAANSSRKKGKKSAEREKTEEANI